MTKCEFCNFGEYGTITEFPLNGNIINGDLGKEMLLKDGMAKGATEMFENSIQLVKATNGYFLSVDELSFTPIKYCPMCGRRLNDEEK